MQTKCVETDDSRGSGTWERVRQSTRARANLYRALSVLDYPKAVLIQRRQRRRGSSVAPGESGILAQSTQLLRWAWSWSVSLNGPWSGSDSDSATLNSSFNSRRRGSSQSSKHHGFSRDMSGVGKSESSEGAKRSKPIKSAVDRRVVLAGAGAAPCNRRWSSSGVPVSLSTASSTAQPLAKVRIDEATVEGSRKPGVEEGARAKYVGCNHRECARVLVSLSLSCAVADAGQSVAVSESARVLHRRAGSRRRFR
mmetsp:Transcript_34617/g.80238  ORF Transcript_34617/g.80238 Transcript_34617/m.80238 type:complete len:253 (-) Transcript_34617:1200-1958(-)